MKQPQYGSQQKACHDFNNDFTLFTAVLVLFIKINTFCTLSVINQTHDKAVKINGNIWVISTLENDKKLCITCLQFSYVIALQFPYDIIYLPDGCEANAITFF